MESKETLFTSCACITNVQKQATTANMNILRFSFMLAKVIKKKISKILFRRIISDLIRLNNTSDKT